MKRLDLDLNLLPIVVALYEERSVSRAAERLGMTQPSLSGALAKLRDSLHDPLFVRAGGAMQPTEKALSLLGPIREVLTMVRDDILEAREFAPGQLTDTITIALSDVGEIVFLPRLLDAVRKEAPGALLRSVNRPHDSLDAALESGEVDLAVGYFPDLTGANIFQQQLFTHHFVCLVRAGHPLAGGGSLTREQFMQMEHAVVRAPGRSQEIFEQFLKAERIERKVVLVTPHFLSIPTIIARSDLVVTVPHAMGIVFGRPEHGLASLQPPFELPRIPLRQHWHRKAHRSARSIWLRELVARLFTEAADEWRR